MKAHDGDFEQELSHVQSGRAATTPDLSNVLVEGNEAARPVMATDLTQSTKASPTT